MPVMKSENLQSKYKKISFVCVCVCDFIYFILFLIKHFLLFNYSRLNFLPTPPPHPS